jgi:hypothetical protein
MVLALRKAMDRAVSDVGRYNREDDRARLSLRHQFFSI